MTTTRRHVAMTGRVEVTVAAPLEAVWQVIADVTRTGQWSHECRHVAWLDGATAAAPGVRFRGTNRSGWLRWTRSCEFFAVEPPHRLGWRTIPTLFFVDSTDWVIELQRVAQGTRIVQTYAVTHCPRWWEWIAVRMIPSHTDRRAALAEDLRRIGACAR